LFYKSAQVLVWYFISQISHLKEETARSNFLRENMLNLRALLINLIPEELPAPEKFKEEINRLQS
jgi:hypothetical protein